MARDSSPSNANFATGVGTDLIKHPFHSDSRYGRVGLPGGVKIDGGESVYVAPMTSRTVYNKSETVTKRFPTFDF
ncbi:MAG: hypothetical protein H8F28_08870 [Fibrella sp.]|nr:hypothetical protein [Armatimonadota bacterium]